MDRHFRQLGECGYARLRGSRTPEQGPLCDSAALPAALDCAMRDDGSELELGPWPRASPEPGIACD